AASGLGVGGGHDVRLAPGLHGDQDRVLGLLDRLARVLHGVDRIRFGRGGVLFRVAQIDRGLLGVDLLPNPSDVLVPVASELAPLAFRLRGRLTRPVLFVPVEPGRRNRRTIDGVVLAAGAVMMSGAAAVARSAPEPDRAVGDAVATVFGWAVALWRVAFI